MRSPQPYLTERISATINAAERDRFLRGGDGSMSTWARRTLVDAANRRSEPPQLPRVRNGDGVPFRVWVSPEHAAQIRYAAAGCGVSVGVWARWVLVAASVDV